MKQPLNAAGRKYIKVSKRSILQKIIQGSILLFYASPFSCSRSYDIPITPYSSVFLPIRVIPPTQLRDGRAVAYIPPSWIIVCHCFFDFQWIIFLTPIYNSILVSDGFSAFPSIEDMIFIFNEFLK